MVDFCLSATFMPPTPGVPFLGVGTLSNVALGSCAAGFCRSIATQRALPPLESV